MDQLSRHSLSNPKLSETQTFEALDKAFNTKPFKHGLIAVSGGADSIALLYFVNSWASTKSIQLSAVTVNHGFRLEAAHEAQFVKKACQKLKLPHETLTPKKSALNHKQPSQSHARDLRYKLLARQAQKLGAEAVFMGHHFDDQLETLLIRKEANSGPFGLAAMHLMAAFPLWPEGRGLTLIRPLLWQRRAQLRAYLEDRNITWIEDPSNCDLRYKRVYFRNALSENKALQNETAQQLQQFATYRHNVLQKIKNEVAPLISWNDWGGARLSLKKAYEILADDTHLALRFIIMSVTGRQTLPKDGLLKVFIDRFMVQPRKEGLKALQIAGAKLSPLTEDTLTITASALTKAELARGIRQDILRARFDITPPETGEGPFFFHEINLEDRPLPSFLKPITHNERQSWPVFTNKGHDQQDIIPAECVKALHQMRFRQFFIELGSN